MPSYKDLNDQQRQMLAWIERAGAMSPSRLAAETRISPEDTWGNLNYLAAQGYVVLREDPESADGTLAFIVPQEPIKKVSDD